MTDEKLEATDELETVEEEDGLVLLADEDGTEVEFEYIGSVDYEGDEYVVLLPAEEDEEGEGAEVLILKVVSNGTAVDEETGEEYEDEQYVSVESEEVLDAVFAIFKKENADAFDFEE